MAARTSIAVLQLVVEHTQHIRPVNAATALHRVAKHRPADLRPVLSHPGWLLLLSLVARHAASFNGQGFGSVLLALGRLKQAPQPLLAQLLPVAQAALPNFKAQELSNLLLGLAYLGHSPGKPFLLAAEQHLLTVLAIASPQAISNSLWALAKLACKPAEPCLAAAAQQFTQIVTTATPQEVANLLWAFVTFKYTLPNSLISAAAQQFVSKVDSATPQEAANLLWACTSLNMDPGSPLLDASAPKLLQSNAVVSPLNALI